MCNHGNKWVDIAYGEGKDKANLPPEDLALGLLPQAQQATHVSARADSQSGADVEDYHNRNHTRLYCIKVPTNIA